jgi:hypothetical protein
LSTGKALNSPFFCTFISHPSDQLHSNILLKQYVIEVELEQLGLYNENIATLLQERPADILPLVTLFYSSIVLSQTVPPQLEAAATKAAKTILFPSEGERDAALDEDSKVFPNIQVTLRTQLNMLPFRDLNVFLPIPEEIVTDSWRLGHHAFKACPRSRHYYLGISPIVTGLQTSPSMPWLSQHSC